MVYVKPNYEEDVMKEGKILLVSAIILLVALPVFASDNAKDVRILNTSSLNPFKYKRVLTDEDLMRLAELSVSENPRIFPTIESFEVEQDDAELTFHGSIDEEKEDLEFISMPERSGIGKYDVAVVKADGTVELIDKEVVIDYMERTIRTFDPITVEEGDVVLLFAKDYVETAFGGVDHRVGRGVTPSGPGPNNPGNPGTTANNGNNNNGGAAAGVP
jgi:hypothetical protein